MIAYYAHPITLFGSKLQEQDMAEIVAAGFDVLNPDDEEKQAGYKKHGMDYFKGLVAQADVVFYRAFPDGRIGAGVVTEVQWALDDGKPCFEMRRQFKARSMDVEQTREMLLECGRK